MPFFNTATNPIQMFVAFKSYLLQLDSMLWNIQFHVFLGTSHLICSMQFSSFNENPSVVPRLFVVDPSVFDLIMNAKIHQACFYGSMGSVMQTKL